MKKICTLVFTLMTLSLFGQFYQYPRTGMVQGIRYSGNIFNPPGNRSIAYSGDTNMCATVYSKYCYISVGGNYSCGTGIYGVFSRMSGMKMYFLQVSCANLPYEFVIYDWGLNVGDTMTIYPQSLAGGLAQVDSVYQATMLNGQQRTYLRLHGIGSFNLNTVYRWIEGIGDIDRGFFAQADFEGGYDMFICQSENDTAIWRSLTNIYDCDSLTTGITEPSMDNFPLTIFPNPFSISATLTVIAQSKLRNAQLFIYDIAGREIRNLTLTAPTTKLERGNLSPGIYFYSIRDGEKQIAAGKFAVE